MVTKKNYIFAIDKETKLVTAHQDSNLVGKEAKDVGLDISGAGKGKAKVNGVTGYYVTEEYEGNIIGTFMPSK